MLNGITDFVSWRLCCFVLLGPPECGIYSSLNLPLLSSVGSFSITMIHPAAWSYEFMVCLRPKWWICYYGQWKNYYVEACSRWYLGIWSLVLHGKGDCRGLPSIEIWTLKFCPQSKQSIQRYVLGGDKQFECFPAIEIRNPNVWPACKWTIWEKIRNLVEIRNLLICYR